MSKPERTPDTPWLGIALLIVVLRAILEMLVSCGGI